MSKKIESTTVELSAAAKALLSVGETAVKSMVVLDSAVSTLESSSNDVANKFKEVFGNIKIGSVWEEMTAWLAKHYADARGVTLKAGEKMVERGIRLMKDKYDISKPQSAEAVKRQKERDAAQLQQIKANVIAGINADESLKKLESLIKAGKAGSGALKKELDPVISQRNTNAAVLKVKAQRDSAIAIVADLCGVPVEKLTQLLSDNYKAFEDYAKGIKAASPKQRKAA